MEMKKCAKCGRELPLKEFGILSRNLDGRNQYCKDCVNKWQRDSYAKRKAKEDGIDNQPPMGGGIEELKQFTPRQLLKELKSRGYVWSNMYIKKNISYESID